MSHLTMIPAPALNVTNWADYGELHRLVMGTFSSTQLPGKATEKRLSRNILFRVDDTSRGKLLLIRSDVAPTNLPREATTKEVLVQSPPNRTPVRFRMTVNAIRRTRPSAPTAKRGTGVSSVDRIAEWVTERLAVGLEDITVFNHDRSVVTSGRSPLQLDVIDGYGVIHDAAALEALIRAGVGRSKAFGCGLLTLARA